MLNEIERLIKKYGKQHEDLIKDSIKWLEQNEKNWNLDKPINRDRYIEDLLSNIAKDN
jgi:hypothetical protein